MMVRDVSSIKTVKPAAACGLPATAAAAWRRRVGVNEFRQKKRQRGYIRGLRQHNRSSGRNRTVSARLVLETRDAKWHAATWGA